jgi:RNA polymerase sigma factor (sigma-70 family)
MLFLRREPTDAELVHEVLQGRIQRFALLVDRYQNLVFSTLLARIRQLDDAEDLAQETFLKAYRFLDSLQDPRKFGPWVRQIAANQALSALRARASRQLSEEDLDLSSPVRPDQALDAKQEHERVWQAIDELSEANREVILLFYIEKVSLEQVAVFLELSPNTVKARLQRARDALREQLAEAEFDRQVRKAVQRRKQGKKFTQKIMSALPLVPWKGLGPAYLGWWKLGWGVQLGMTTLMGLGMLGYLLGWWPGRELKVYVQAPAPVEMQAGGAASGAGPLGAISLSGRGAEAQQEALRRGWGGQVEWGFDQPGDPEGWIAQEGVSSGTDMIFPVLRSQVQGGVWRVQVIPYQPDKNPSVSLLSPPLGYDSALFDRLVIRLRVVHSEPISGTFLLRWTNPANALTPGYDPTILEKPCANPNCEPRFWRIDKPVYTTGWQEVEIRSLRSSQATWPDRGEYQTLWSGQLQSLQLDLELMDPLKPRFGSSFVQGPEEVPQAVEVDWIKLMGAAGQLERELPSPPAPVRASASGRLFAPAVFSPLGVREVGCPINEWMTGALGDLDGDGDLDLVAPWQSNREGRGWLLSYYEGQGRFARTQVDTFSGAGPTFAGGADFDGNGLMDLVLYPGKGQPIQVWFNSGRGEWRIEDLPDFSPVQVVDLDQDNDPDLLGWEWRQGEGFYNSPRLLFNEGKGRFSAISIPQAPVEQYLLMGTVYPTSRRLNLAWTPPYSPGGKKNQVLTSQHADGAISQEILSLPRKLAQEQIIKVGDFDLDGDTDLATSDHSFRPNSLSSDDPVPTLGLNLLRNRGDGQVDTVGRYPELRYWRNLQVMDVNQDEIPDVVVVHKEIRDPAVVVLLGQGGGRFVQEGRYPLADGQGGAVLGGDLDRDGDLDLVVFDSYVLQGAGVHVLLNRSVESQQVAIGR